jgi:3-hydroxyisobutyrate dehydrogenase
MGGPMAGRLVSAGFALTVWNRTEAKAAPLRDAGAVWAESPAALTEASDFVFLCLMDAASVAAVVFGPGGVVEGRAEICVDFSTGHPDAARDIAQRLKAANGMGWIDAPVSGGVDGAKAGTLAIMAGGAEADIERVRPAVAAMSARFTRMGDVGAGQATKLVNQIISGCTIAVVAEAVAFAEKTGVDAARLTEALGGGFADSKPFQIFAPRMAAHAHEPILGATDTMIKDLDLVEAVAARAGAKTPLTDAALRLMRDSAAAGDGGMDISAIIRQFD